MINQNLVGEFLQKLYSHDPELYARVVTPDIMFNQHNDTHLYKVEGALGSLIFNINRAVLHNKVVRDIWEDVSNSKPFLNLVNLDPKERNKFFTPIKNSIDYYLYAHSGRYKLEDNVLISSSDSQIQIEGDLVSKNGCYSDVQNLIDSFGKNPDMGELEYFEVRGVFVIPNLVFKGKVVLISEFSQPIGVEVLNKFMGILPDNRIILQDILIFIDQEGKIETTSLSIN